mmetsp:Transcript_29598/g.96395  ORF Transcript_29598/g.96395 Transcript_29598/m.96395 type:complete len:208 (-) Transcript_29598:63-686(-)
MRVAPRARAMDPTGQETAWATVLKCTFLRSQKVSTTYDSRLLFSCVSLMSFATCFRSWRCSCSRCAICLRADSRSFSRCLARNRKRVDAARFCSRRRVRGDASAGTSTISSFPDEGPDEGEPTRTGEGGTSITSGFGLATPRSFEKDSRRARFLWSSSVRSCSACAELPSSPATGSKMESSSASCSKVMFGRSSMPTIVSSSKYSEP